jgi:hypothetical protein
MVNVQTSWQRRAVMPRHPSSSSIASRQSCDTVPSRAFAVKGCRRRASVAHSLASGLEKDEWSAVEKSGCDGKCYGAGEIVSLTTEQACACAAPLIRPSTGQRAHSFSELWRSTPGSMAGRDEAPVKLSPSRGIVSGQASLLDLSAPVRDGVLLPEVRCP